MQAAVLELLLDVRHAEAVRDGRVDLHRLERLVSPLLLGPAVAGAHVVQPVAQFDEHDAHVLGHGEKHFTQVLGLLLLNGREFDAAELRDAVDQQRDLRAELLADLVERDVRILHNVVEQRGADGIGVEAEVEQDAGHRDGVADITLARQALLSLVRGLRHMICAFDDRHIV